MVRHSGRNYGEQLSESKNEYLQHLLHSCTFPDFEAELFHG
jgi:hypothetical protein